MRLSRFAQNTANIAPPTRQMPSIPSAMPDIHDDVQPIVAGSVLSGWIGKMLKTVF